MGARAEGASGAAVTGESSPPSPGAEGASRGASPAASGAPSPSADGAPSPSAVLRVAAAFLVIVGGALLWMPVALLLLPWRVARLEACGAFGTLLGAAVLAIGGIRLRVRGGERLRGSFPAIYVTNHVSALDVFVSMRLCPVGGCGVMTSDVRRIPAYGLLYRLSGHVILDRDNTRGALRIMEELAGFVRAHGLGVWILPEGGRSDDGRLRAFKTGFVRLAVETGLPVVPVVLHRVHHVWARKRFPTLSLREIEVDVLPPIDTRGWQLATRRAHAAQVHALVAAALGPDQRPREAADL